MTVEITLSGPGQSRVAFLCAVRLQHHIQISHWSRHLLELLEHVLDGVLVGCKFE
jgi:hypothetical protein